MADIAVARAPFTAQSNRPLQRERGEIDTNWRLLVSRLHLEQWIAVRHTEIIQFFPNDRHRHTRQKVACPTHNLTGRGILAAGGQLSNDNMFMFQGVAALIAASGERRHGFFEVRRGRKPGFLRGCHPAGDVGPFDR
jgi:hypothetical protein